VDDVALAEDLAHASAAARAAIGPVVERLRRSSITPASISRRSGGRFGVRVAN